MRCDTSYIPLWPIFYRREKHSYTRLHILWPLVTYFTSEAESTLALLYILFRLTFKNSKMYFDLFWPIIHFEYDYDTGGFHFGIRPLFWLIVTPKKTQIALMGLIHFRYKDNGDDIWFVLAPFVWYRSHKGKAIFTIPPLFWVIGNDRKDTLKFYLIPFGALNFYGSKGWSFTLLLLFHIGKSDVSFTMFLLPFFFVRTTASGATLNFGGLLHIRVEDSGDFYWFLLPMIWHFKSASSHRFMIIPFFFYLKKSSLLEISVLALYYYRKSATSKLHFIALIYIYFTDALNKKFLNIMILFNYVKSESKTWTVLFPFLWIKIKHGESFLFHLWPAFGYKISQKSQGYNIYFLYPAIIYKNKKNGQFTLLNILFPMIHFYSDTEFGAKRSCILPIFFSSNISGIRKGFILLYYWYIEKDRYKIKNPTIQYRDEIKISAPDNNGLKDYPVEVELNSINNGDITTGGEFDQQQQEIEELDQRKVEEDELPNSKYSLKIRGLLPLILFAVKGNDEKFLVILPLFICKWAIGKKDSYFVSLIYYQRIVDNWQKRWLIPVFYQKKFSDNNTLVSPVFLRVKRGTSQLTLILPIFIDIVKGESHIMILLFPTFIHYRKSIFKFTTLFPFYFQTQDASKGEYFVYYFPIFGSSSKGSTSRNYYFLFPIFGYKRRDEENTIVFDVFYPIFHYEKSDTSHSIRFLPIFWKSVNDYHDFLLVMPIYWKFITNKDTPQPQINVLVFPFYFKRKSSEYDFKFASPMFLPPYYIKYQREASHVNQTYLFPFYAHKIKGSDHLRWFLLFIYRHTWSDFSDNYAMNVLLYFSRNTQKRKTSGIIPLWVQWFEKEKQKYHLRIIFLLALDRMKSDLVQRSRVAILWIFHRKLSMFVSSYSRKQKNVDSNEYNERSKVFLVPFIHYKSRTSDGYFHLSFFWLVKPIIAFFHHKSTSTSDESYTHIFLIYYRMKSAMLSITALVWLIHPVVSLFLRESTVFSTITRVFPLFYHMKASSSSSTMNENSLTESRKVKGAFLFNLFYIYPGFGFFNFRKTQDSISHYIALIYNYYSDSDIKMFAVIWIASPIISMFYSQTNKTATGDDEGYVNRLFPVYYISNEDSKFNLSILWIGHPVITMIRYYKSLTSSVFSIFPIFWKRYTESNKTLEVSFMYLVRRYGFINYLSNPEGKRFYIVCIIWCQQFGEYFKFSLIYLIHPRIAFFRISSKPSQTKSFLVLVYYYLGNWDHETVFSLMWIGHPKISLISYYSKAQLSRFYIAFILWFSRIEEFSQFGLLWLFPKKYSISGNQFIKSTTGGSQSISNIYIPVSLFLYMNVGEMQVVHLMPIFRYSNNVVAEKERFWTLFGMIYFASNHSHPDFRLFYRLIRVKSAANYFLVEVNPFFIYKKKNSESKFLLLGGCCGCYRRSHGNLDTRVLCIEC